MTELRKVNLVQLLQLLFNLFACQSKWDVTSKSGILLLLLMIFVVFLIKWLSALLVVKIHFWTYDTINLVWASVAIISFIAVLTLDTQLLLSGNHAFHITPDKYVYGALAIYLDLIKTFFPAEGDRFC